jgi:exportin-2 (importin alpha re-exporter)
MERDIIYIFTWYLYLDTDTRRRAAADFIRGLMERYEVQVTRIMSGYVNNYLEVNTTNIYK